MWEGEPERDRDEAGRRRGTEDLTAGSWPRTGGYWPRLPHSTVAVAGQRSGGAPQQCRAGGWRFGIQRLVLNRIRSR